MSRVDGNPLQQVIGQALARSVSHDEIVTLRLVSGDDVDAYRDALEVECEGSTDAGPGRWEFWGEILGEEDTMTWRVHLETES